MYTVSNRYPFITDSWVRRELHCLNFFICIKRIWIKLFVNFVNNKKSDIESKRELNDIDGVHSIACKHIEYQWHYSLSCICSFRTNYILSPVTCHLSPVTCHLSPVTCHLSPVRRCFQRLQIALALRARTIFCSLRKIYLFLHSKSFDYLYKLHDPKFNCQFIISILKSQNLIA